MPVEEPETDAGGGGPHEALPVPDSRLWRLHSRGDTMITAVLITVVVIALAAGFILNRDNTQLRP
jgi:hypothetical protein